MLSFHKEEESKSLPFKTTAISPLQSLDTSSQQRQSLDASQRSQLLSDAFNRVFSISNDEVDLFQNMVMGKYLSIKRKTVFPTPPPTNEDHMSDLTRRPKTSHSSMRPPMTIYVDGPYGAPSSSIFDHVDHAVLVATGIGVTPFASILQSIMYKFWEARKQCPNCDHTWSDPGSCASKSSRQAPGLKKVDFVWINRDQKSFEWFLQLLSQLEMEQAEYMEAEKHFLDIHLYITSFSPTKSINAVALKLALDLMHQKVNMSFLNSKN